MPNDLICPKCGKPAYHGKVVIRKKLVGPLKDEVRLYKYRRFYHYVGSTTHVTLGKLRRVLLQNGMSDEQVEKIISDIRKNQPIRRLEHYYKEGELKEDGKEIARKR